MSKVLGIDLGTSGCKLVLLDEDGELVVTRSKELFPITRPDGTVEQDPTDWYRAVIDCLTLMKREDAVDLHTISAVGVTGQMQGITVVDQDCGPIRNSILWNDIRSEAETAALKRDHQDFLEDTIGCPFSTGLTLSKVMWLKVNESENWERTFKFMHASNFIIAKLTGRMTADQNNLGQSGLNDFAKNDWSQEIIAVFGVEADKVPELVRCFDVVGAVTPTAARETGLKPGTAVVAAGGDSGAESYSISLADSSRMKIRLGTAGDMNIVMHASKVDMKRPRGIRDVMSDYVLFGAYTRACAFSVSWARAVFYSDLPADGSTYERMDQDAMTVPPGSDGLLYFPYLNGEASPYFDSLISAKFLGIRGGMDRRFFARAVYEGVSYSIRDVIRSTPEFDFARQYVFVGGGTKSKLWVSILADVLGRDAIIPANCDAAFGAALIAGHGAGIWDGQIMANRNIANHVGISASDENRATYNEGFARYLEFAGK